MNSIYALIDPRNNAIRYVGKTCNPDSRLRSHCYSKAKTHCSRWIQSLKKEGWFLEMAILEDGLSEEEWPEREIHWIEHFKTEGAKLTNIADGGRGVTISGVPALPYGYTLGYKVPALSPNEMCVYFPEHDLYRFFQLTEEQAQRAREQEAMYERTQKSTTAQETAPQRGVVCYPRPNQIPAE